MAYAIGTDKREGTRQPEKSSGGLASIASKVGSAAKPAADSPTGRITPAPPKSEESRAVTNAGRSGQSVADTVNIWATDSSGTAPTKRTVQTTTVTPARQGFTAPAENETRNEQKVTRPVGGLNSDKFYQRVQDNGGVVPFEGPVDWKGIGDSIYDFLQAPADRRMERESARQPVSITVGGQGTPTYDKVDPDTKLSFGMLLDLLGTPEVSNRYMTPGPDMERLPAGPSPVGKQMPPTYDDANIVRAYGDTVGVSEPIPALGGIETAVNDGSLLQELQEPSIVQSADAGDLFETDGRMLAPDGTVINPGGPSGVNAAVPEPAKEPSVWDGVVDNTGKLLSHTALGGIVSTLFPDMWSGMGDAFKGIGTGAPNSLLEPTGNPSATYWNPSTGGWTNDQGGVVDRYSFQVDSSMRNNPNAPTPATPTPGFPDLNHNGVDDRIEADVLVVVAYGGLGRGREDRLRQLLRLLQAGGQGDAAQRAGRPVILPARTDQVAACDRLHRHRLQPPRHHRALLVQREVGTRRQHLGQRHVEQVVRHQVRSLAEPEIRHLGQHLALAGDRIGQHHVECGQTVGGDHQQPIVGQRVDIAHLAAVDQFESGKLRLRQGGGHGSGFHVVAGCPF